MKKTRLMSFIAFLMMIMAVLSASVITSFASSAQTDIDCHANQEEVEFQEVISYVDIFKCYYDRVSEITTQTSVEICGFEEFWNNYYTSNLSISEYSDMVAGGEMFNENATARSSSSSDANYILSSTDYATTPASDFERVPVVGFYNYEGLEKGDIVFETSTILNNVGHTGIISDVTKPKFDGSYIQTIEAVGGGVQFGFLDDDRMVKFGVRVGRNVYATVEVIDDVIYFCRIQLGKSYSFSLTRTNTSISSSSWYCSELLYAAFYYAGQDMQCINANGGCLPHDLINSLCLRPQLDFMDNMLSIRIHSKSGSKWTISVYNNTGSTQTVFYNTKMCNNGDARNWTGLNNVVNISVNSSASKNVDVSENWFATSVTFSYINSGRRFVTFADELSLNPYTMNVKFNCI